MATPSKYELINHGQDEQFLISRLYITSGPSMKRKHSHDFYELGFLIDSKNESPKPLKIEIQVGDMKYFFGDTTFTIIPPGIEHIAIRPKNIERIIINFRHEFAEAVFGFLNIDIDEFCKKCIIPVPENLLPPVLELLQIMHKEYTLYKMSPFLKLSFAKLINTLNDINNDNNYDTEYSTKLSPIIDYIDSHFESDITLDMLAQKFYINKFTICRELKNSMNTTFSEYLTKVRINKACSLLSNTNTSILNTAQSCGFKSSEYFSKTFKKVVGISPSEYKKKMS